MFNIEEEKVLAFFKKELGDKFKYRKITMNKSKGIGEITVNSKEIADLLYSLNGKVKKLFLIVLLLKKKRNWKGEISI